MKSRVNPDFTVTRDMWAVSLVRRAFHAFIVVESFGYENDKGFGIYEDVGLGIRWFELSLKKGHCQCLSKVIPGILFNKTILGDVRFGGLSHQYVAKGQGLSRESLFEWRHWNEKDAVTWLCDKNKVLNMIEDIKKDILLSDEKKFKFRYRGNNCTTWTINKLKVANIDVKQPKHHLFVQAKSTIKKNVARFFRRVHDGQIPENIEEYINTMSSATAPPVMLPYRKTK